MIYDPFSLLQLMLGQLFLHAQFSKYQNLSSKYNLRVKFLRNIYTKLENYEQKI